MTLLKSYLMNTTNPFILTRVYYDEVLMKAKDSYRDYIRNEPSISFAMNEIKSWKMKINKTVDSIDDIEDEIEDTKKIIDGFSPKEITAPKEIVERRKKARKEEKGYYIPDWLPKLNTGDKIPLPAGWKIKNDNEVWENVNYRKKDKRGETLEVKWKKHDNIQVIPRKKPDVSAFGEMATEGEKGFSKPDKSTWYIQMRAGQVIDSPKGKPKITTAYREFEPVLEEEFEWWKDWLKDLKHTVKVFKTQLKIEKNVLQNMEKELDAAIEDLFENIKFQGKERDTSKEDRLKIISISEKAVKNRIKQYKEYGKIMGTTGYVTPEALTILREQHQANLKAIKDYKGDVKWRQITEKYKKNKRKLLESMDFKTALAVEYDDAIEYLKGSLETLAQKKKDIKSGKALHHGGEYFVESEERIFNSILSIAEQTNSVTSKWSKSLSGTKSLFFKSGFFMSLFNFFALSFFWL